MRRFAGLTRWLTLAAAAVAMTAMAQKEQWLQYHTSSEGRGYRWLDLSTNPPAGVAAPKVQGEVYFARWTTPMDPSGGRWLCLTASRKGGLCDRLYFDANGNGRLDDETPRKASRTDDYSASFEPERIVFKGEDGPVTYHLLLRAMKYSDEQVRLLASSGGYYSGAVEIGGKKRQVQLIDGNVNGTFNDRSSKSSDTDRISISDATANEGGQPEGERYLGRLVEVDKQYFRVEVPRDGAFIKIQKEEATLGKARVPESVGQVTVFGENGQFNRKPTKGEFTVPVGAYRVMDWNIDRKDGKGEGWQLTGYNFPEESGFKVVADQVSAVELGEPLRTLMDATPMTNEVAFSLRFIGRAGETIQFMKGNQRPAGPKLALVSQEGSFRATNTFEFG